MPRLVPSASGTLKVAAFAAIFASTGLVGSRPGNIEAVDRGIPESSPIDIAATARPGINSAAAADARQDLAILADQPNLALAAGSESVRYAIGDRLKITIYEQLAGEAAASGRRRTLSLIERAEFTGEYVVQLSGEVFLPIIGAVSVAQSTPAQAMAALLAKVSATTGEQLKVSVVVTDREPVYVMGGLPRAGVYKYSPGMVVVQAVALAGGKSGTTENTWQRIDVAREQERMHKAVERLQRNLATIDVLVAEQKKSKPQPSARLSELAGTNASAFIEMASQIRAAERARLHLQVASLEKLITALKNDLAVSRSRLDQVAGAVRERSQRRDDLATRLSRGVSTENLAVQARNELVDVQSSFHEAQSAMSRTEVRILELERDRDQAILAAQIEQEAQLRTARQAIADEEILLSTIGPLLLMMATTTSAVTRTARDVEYAIIRRMAGVPTQIVAEALTPLEPGDVLQVTRGKSELNTAIVTR